MISINVSTFVASTLLLTVSPLGETLEFTPKAETTVVRSMHVERGREVESSTIFIMGQEIDAGGGMTTTLTREVKLVDVIGEVEDGQVMDFVRTYETISDQKSVEGAGEGLTIADGDDESSDLEGQKVAFKWDVEEEAYTSAYEGDDAGEDEWLAGLAASLDLVNWLPSSEMSEGDKWDVSLDELGSVIWYGGYLFPIEEVEESDGPAGGINLSVPNFSAIQELSGAEGEIKMTLVRIEEEDDQRIAVATFELTGSVEQDLAELANALNEARGDDLVFESAEQSIEMTGSGELRWDLVAGRLAGLTLNLEQEVGHAAEWSIEAHGTDMEVTFEGTHSTSFQIELTEEQTDSKE